MSRLIVIGMGGDGRHRRVGVVLEAGWTDGWTDAWMVGWMEEVGVAGEKKGVEEGEGRREHGAKPSNKD